MKKFMISMISSLMMLGFATEVQAAVRAQERVLIILTDLDTHGIPELAPLYSTLEEVGIGLPRLPILRDNYREIHVLRNQRATLANFKALSLALANRPEIEAIDVFLMLHGLDGRLAFADRRYNMADMQSFMTSARNATEEARITTMKRKFRLMYNTSCFGSSHRSAFRNMGFDVVVGSIAVNANSEAEYPSFLALWNGGARLQDAFVPTNNPAALVVTDGPLVTAGRFMNNFLRHVNSRKVFSGNTAITINTDPR